MGKMFELKNALEGNKVALPKETIYESGIGGPIGIALAMIKESEPHYHNEMTEWYMVVEGSAIAFIDSKEVRLKKYDVLKIPPKSIHYVKAEEGVEVWVVSHPPWRKEDHILAKL